MAVQFNYVKTMIEIEVENGHHENWFTTGEFAKMLHINDSVGKTVGRNKMYALLRENGILMKTNEPYQWVLNLELVRMHMVEKRGKTYYLPIFSIRGLNYVQKQIENGSFITKMPPTRNRFVKNINEIL